MEAIAIQTETITPIKPTELLEETLRVLAKLNDGEGASTVTVEAHLAPNIEDIKFFWAFLREGEKDYQRKNSTTIKFPVGPKKLKRKLTAKQKLAVEYVEQWRKGDPDKQTVALEHFMRDLEEDRHGGR